MQSSRNIIVGLLIMILGLFLGIYINGDIYSEYRLLSNGKLILGSISEVSESVVKEAKGNSPRDYVYHYDYHFQLPTGKIVESSQDVSLKRRIIDHADYLDVIYLEENPQINMIKSSMCTSMVNFIWKKLTFGAFVFILFCIVGIILIKS